MTETRIDIPDKIVRNLDRLIVYEYGAKVEKHLVEIRMGAKYQIYANEHSPPHFHVSKGDDEVSFDLRTGKVLKSTGDSRKLRRAVQKAFPNLRSKLVNIWNKIRPTDCAVGEVDPDTLPKLPM